MNKNIFLSIFLITLIASCTVLISTDVTAQDETASIKAFPAVPESLLGYLAPLAGTSGELTDVDYYYARLRKLFWLRRVHHAMLLADFRDAGIGFTGETLSARAPVFKCYIPDDPYFSSSGVFTGHDDMWGWKRIGMEDAWEYSTGTDIIVAVLDTGIDYYHPELDSQLWYNLNDPINGIDDDGNGYVDDYLGWDFIGEEWTNPSEDNDVMDIDGHGTHVSGIIAAEDNTEGIIGVAYGAKILPVRVLDDEGSGTYEAIADGIRYAVDMGARVLNLSLGGYISMPSTLVDAIAYAISEGAIIVAAAGNDSTDADDHTPSNDPNIIAVAAMDPDDDISSFSNYGSTIEVAAPGRDILSLHAYGSDMYGDDDHYVPDGDEDALYYWANGTSMATPFVSGLAALLLSQDPGLTLEDLRTQLYFSAEDLGPAGWDEDYGYGLINAHNALKYKYYDSGNVRSVTYTEADEYGFIYYEYLDEDFWGGGWGRTCKAMRPDDSYELYNEYWKDETDGSPTNNIKTKEEYDTAGVLATRYGYWPDGYTVWSKVDFTIDKIEEWFWGNIYRKLDLEEDGYHSYTWKEGHMIIEDTPEWGTKVYDYDESWTYLGYTRIYEDLNSEGQRVRFEEKYDAENRLLEKKEWDRLFYTGVNFPWTDYGKDIGESSADNVLPTQRGYSTDREDIDEKMRQLAGSVARVFLFCDLRSGMRFDGDGNITGFDEQTVSDLRELLNSAQANGVKLILTLFDYTLAEGVTGVRWDPGTGEIIEEVGEYPELISDPVKRAQLVNAVKDVFDRVGLENYSSVVGFDIMNEPEFARDGLDYGEHPENVYDPDWSGGVPEEDLKDLVYDFKTMLNTHFPDRFVTLGHKDIEELIAWDMSLDAYQFHYYDWMASSPDHAALGDYTQDDLGMDSWVFAGELDPTDYNGKLSTLYDTGYYGGLFWRDSAGFVMSPEDLDYILDWFRGTAYEYYLGSGRMYAKTTSDGIRYEYSDESIMDRGYGRLVEADMPTGEIVSYYYREGNAAGYNEALSPGVYAEVDDDSVVMVSNNFITYDLDIYEVGKYSVSIYSKQIWGGLPGEDYRFNFDIYLDNTLIGNYDLAAGTEFEQSGWVDLGILYADTYELRMEWLNDDYSPGVYDANVCLKGPVLQQAWYTSEWIDTYTFVNGYAGDGNTLLSGGGILYKEVNVDTGLVSEYNYLNALHYNQAGSPGVYTTLDDKSLVMISNNYITYDLEIDRLGRYSTSVFSKQIWGALPSGDYEFNFTLFLDDEYLGNYDLAAGADFEQSEWIDLGILNVGEHILNMHWTNDEYSPGTYDTNACLKTPVLLEEWYAKEVTEGADTILQKFAGGSQDMIDDSGVIAQDINLDTGLVSEYLWGNASDYSTAASPGVYADLSDGSVVMISNNYVMYDLEITELSAYSASIFSKQIWGDLPLPDYNFNFSVFLDGAYVGNYDLPAGTDFEQSGWMDLGILDPGTYSLALHWTNDAYLPDTYDANVCLNDPVLKQNWYTRENQSAEGLIIEGYAGDSDDEANDTGRIYSDINLDTLVISDYRWGNAADYDTVNSQGVYATLGDDSIVLSAGWSSVVYGIEIEEKGDYSASIFTKQIWGGLPSPDYMFNFNVYLDDAYIGNYDFSAGADFEQSGWVDLGILGSGAHSLKLLWTNDAYSPDEYNANVCLKDPVLKDSYKLEDTLDGVDKVSEDGTFLASGKKSAYKAQVEEVLQYLNVRQQIKGYDQDFTPNIYTGPNDLLERS